jgi:hypothetical protein
MTFGWHKEADTIANRQFCEATGIEDRRNIYRTVRQLEARKIIVVCRDDKEAASFRINRNLADWQLSSIKTTVAKPHCRRNYVVHKDDNLSSVDTAQGASVEMSCPSSRKTTSEDIRKEIKERKENSRSRADFLQSHSRMKNAEPQPTEPKRSLMAAYLDWKAENDEEITFQTWFSKYG